MSTDKTVVILLAIYPYESRAEKNLSLVKGDKMKLIKEGDADWWIVQHLKTSKVGLVPKGFVSRINNIENEKWYAGRIPRTRAEKILSNPNLPSGSYLIRQKETAPYEYVLTIRCYDKYNQEFRITHYEIKTDESGMLYVATKRIEMPTFRSLEELVTFYTKTACGLCCTLSNPVAKTVPSKKLNWDLQRNQLQLKKQLGSGNFGEVWYGTWRGIVEVAIKTLKQSNDSVTPEVFLQEAEKLNLCDHPNILKFYGVCSGEDPFYIITEYMCNGSLLEYLRCEKNHPTIEVFVNIATQIANGMTWLEEIQLVHRDLAARNILLGQKLNGVPNVKIADFGLAYSITDPEINADLEQFPTRWTAPEILNRTGISSKSDIWSYGILLYELFSKGTTPYEGLRIDIKLYVKEGNRLSKPYMCPSNIYEEVMLECWLIEDESRPTFVQLYNFFNNYFLDSNCQHLALCTLP